MAVSGNGSDPWFLLLENGTIKVGSGNHFWVNGGADSSTNYIIPGLTNIVQIADGIHSMYALASDGAVYSWGYVSGSSNHLGRAGPRPAWYKSSTSTSRWNRSWKWSYQDTC